MRAQCQCGHRQRVTSAQCGRPIRCVCGISFEVPSLRQLKLMAAENMIVEIFDDPAFWASSGCFVCDRAAETEFRTQLQLQPAIYETVVIGPERRSAPLVATIASVLFGRLAGHLVFAADAATQATEQVLVQEAAAIEFSLQACELCASKDDIQSSLAHTLSFHQLFLEMKEDFPAIHIANIAAVQ